MLSRKIAFTGILSGVASVLVYLAVIVPSGKLFLYFSASLPVSAAIIEFGAGAGISVYFASSILSLLFTGSIFGIVPFVFFFGHYPIFKYLIEKRRPPAAEVLLKLVVFNLSGLLWYLAFKNLFISTLPERFFSNGTLKVFFAAVMQVIFFIYDYLYSAIIFYYESKLRILK